MYTIFFISGYLIPNSLKNKSAWTFLASKFRRIMIPWMVAVLTMIPAYKAIFLYSRGLPQEAWYTYFHFFQRTGGDLSSFADNPVMNWLWFLPVLFVFQMIYLGLSKTKLLSLNISLKTGVLLTLVAGVAYSMLITELDLRGWYHSFFLHFQNERVLVYFFVFLLGSLCNRLMVFEWPKNTKLYIWANVSLTLSLGIFTAVALNLFFNLIDPARNFFFVSQIVDRIAYYTTLLTSMFSFLYVFLHSFRFSFNKTNPLMRELNNNSYAVYIIHLPIVGLVALLLFHVSLPAMVKFLLVAVIAFAVSNLLVTVYHKTLQHFFSKKIFRYAVPAIFSLLAIAVYANQVQASSAFEQMPQSETTANIPAISLHAAVIEGNLEAVKQHIAAGSDLNLKEPSGGSSPLILASLLGKTEIAQALIDAGADVNQINNEGSTALHTAAFFCRPDIVNALLAAGADTSVRNNSGSTAQASVSAPFQSVKGVYDYFSNTLGPIGLELDYTYLETTRPQIAEMLQQ
jgi:hypothetical protein